MPEINRSKVPDQGPLQTDSQGNITNKLSFPWLLLMNDLNKRACRVQDNYANDAAAAVGGIQIGQEYHTSGTKKIRIA